MTNICNISGVPRSTHTIVLDTILSGANLLIEQNAISNPKGIANIRVEMNIITDDENPSSNRNDTFANCSINYPFYLRASALIPTLYFSARAVMVPSAYFAFKKASS